MTIWFTADTHFGHENIITYCDRPFSSAEEMDTAMIANWNSTVGTKDTVYVLGDFLFRNARYSCSQLLDRLRGRKVLIVGNHDPEDTRNCNRWISVYDYRLMREHKKRFVLMHYPIESWQFMRHGAIHLHGHSHGNMRKIEGRTDVGVDCWNFTPVAMETLIDQVTEV